MIEFLKRIALEESLDRTKMYRIGMASLSTYHYRKQLVVFRSGWFGMLMIFDVHRIK